MRVVTLNMLHGRSQADGEVDIRRLQQGVASLDADVLALQEVDRDQPRSGGADLAAIAAEAMGAVDHRFVATLHGRADDGWGAARGVTRPGTPAYGIALLSRLPVVSWEVLRLPTPRGRVLVRHRGEVLPTLLLEEPRAAMAALVATPSGTVTVVNTHLSFVRWSNGRQLRALTRSLPGPGRPLLLVGDLNMGPTRARRLTGMTTLASTGTFPADLPRAQLDHVLADDHTWHGVSSESRVLPFSDHRALVVDLH